MFTLFPLRYHGKKAHGSYAWTRLRIYSFGHKVYIYRDRLEKKGLADPATTPLLYQAAGGGWVKRVSAASRVSQLVRLSVVVWLCWGTANDKNRTDRFTGQEWTHAKLFDFSLNSVPSRGNGPAELFAVLTLLRYYRDRFWLVRLGVEKK